MYLEYENAQGEIVEYTPEMYAQHLVDTAPPTLEEKKAAKSAELAKYYNQVKTYPTTDTGLSFRVDSGYGNLRDFEVVYDLVNEYLADTVAFRANKTVDEVNVIDALYDDDTSLVTVRDANNEYQTVTVVEMAGIIQSIKNYGFRAKTSKWQMEEAIKAATLETIDSLDVTYGWP